MEVAFFNCEAVVNQVVNHLAMKVSSGVIHFIPEVLKIAFSAHGLPGRLAVVAAMASPAASGPCRSLAAAVGTFAPEA